MSRSVRFAVAFGVSVVLGHLALSLPLIERTIVAAWVRANVALATVAVGATAGERVMIGDGVHLTIGKGCDGLGALLVVTAAIIAAPARIARRLVGLVAAASVVFLANAARLATLYLVARDWPDRLELFHVDIWQPVMMLVALGTFLLWGHVSVDRASA